MPVENRLNTCTPPAGGGTNFHRCTDVHLGGVRAISGPVGKKCLENFRAYRYRRSRIVSISSMGAGIALAGFTALFYKLGVFDIERPLVYFTLAICLLVIITHRANIKRLLSGTENRIGHKGS